MARLRIKGLDQRSPVERVIDEHRSGARKIRPLTEYQKRPLDFLVEVLKFPRHTLVWSDNPGYARHKWDGTPNPLARACSVLAGEIPGKKHAAIEAATGTQKTYTAAGLVLWFLASFEDSLVITTGSKADQLKVGLWKEIGIHLHAFKRRFPKVQAVELKLRMRPVLVDPFGGDIEMRQEKWSAIGWCAGVDANAESAVRSQGFHAEHMMIVFEEMPGQDGAVVTALKNTCTAPHNIMLGLGNPDNQLDELHKFSELPNVEAIRISAYDHPNVVCNDPSIVPGATSRDFIAAELHEYGEDGPLFLSRVRGISPKEAHNALIKMSWLGEAARKWEDPTLRVRYAQGLPALGVDPAQSENGDRCALARWLGSALMSVEKVGAHDALAFGEEVWNVMRREKVAPQNVGVDSVGVGSNVVNYLRRVLPPGQFVVEIHGGAEEPIGGAMPSAERSSGTTLPHQYTNDANSFLNMRAQVYWQLAQDLAHGLVAIPRHPQLWKELMAPTYSTEGGVVRLEKKKDIVKKLGRSPDFADAVAYGNWVRSRPEAALPPRRPSAEDIAKPIDMRTGRPLKESDRSRLWETFDRQQAARQIAPRPFRLPRRNGPMVKIDL